MSSDAFALVREEDGILHVVLNRQERLNALHSAAHFQLATIFDRFEASPALRVAIITGAGPRAFCAGNDLRVQAAGGAMERPPSGFGGLTLRHDRRKPVIAAVNGFALGGGCEMVLAADLAIAAENARFALPETLRGLVPLAGVHLLARRVGLKDALGLLLTGRQIAAAEALRIGLVNEVVPEGQAVAAATEWARLIVQASPAATAACLAMVRESLAIPDTATAMAAPSAALEQLRASADFVEGPLAFAERRPPRWTA